MSARSAPSPASGRTSNQPTVLRLRPYKYIHVFDSKTSVTEVYVGPLTYTRQDSEKVVSPDCQPQEMLMIPPRQYVVIENPVVRNAQRQPTRDKNGNYQLLQSETEIRLTQEPFPLYPGERVKGDVTELTFVDAGAALRISAQREFAEDRKS